jgi:hypothetical protein
MNYILFECMDCKKMVAYPERFSDGHRCKRCRGWSHGMLKPIDKGSIDMLKDKYADRGEILFVRSKTDNGTSNVSISMSTTLGLEDITKIATGLRLVDALSWISDRVNFDSVLQSDKETKDIIIKESDLMKLIQLVNPHQKDRHIILVNDNSEKNTVTAYDGHGGITARTVIYDEMHEYPRSK